MSRLSIHRGETKYNVMPVVPEEPRDNVKHELNIYRRKYEEAAGELGKAEATIRNQDVELRRLRARVAELESR